MAKVHVADDDPQGFTSWPDGPPVVAGPESDPDPPRFTTPGERVGTLRGHDVGVNSDAPASWTRHDANGFYYDWRPEPYQSPLSSPEIAQQKDEYTFRRANAGRKLPEDSAGLQQTIAQSQSGVPGASRTRFASAAPGLQFDDPYTARLEGLINQHLEGLSQPQSNPAMDRLLQFLNQQFTNLSTAPGYSPEDLAVMRTQMLEPIERDRTAGRERVLQRTAARGMLPSSGLHEQDLQEFVDRPANEARTAAQRDIAINAIDRRRSDLTQAANVGRVAAVDIPTMQRDEDRSRRSESLNLASLLYDLPNRALQENMSVINGTPGPESLFGQAIQLQHQQNQDRALNAQKWAQIGQLLAGLF